jgi:hypothetical protein
MWYIFPGHKPCENNSKIEFHAHIDSTALTFVTTCVHVYVYERCVHVYVYARCVHVYVYERFVHVYVYERCVHVYVRPVMIHKAARTRDGFCLILLVFSSEFTQINSIALTVCMCMCMRGVCMCMCMRGLW